MYSYYSFNLFDIINERFSKDIDAIRYLFAGIALGVNELHKNSLAHCDLKPTNILIDDDMKPVIGDYGSSGAAIVEKFEMRGTGAYMPPEYFN